MKTKLILISMILNITSIAYSLNLDCIEVANLDGMFFLDNSKVLYCETYEPIGNRCPDNAVQSETSVPLSFPIMEGGDCEVAVKCCKKARRPPVPRLGKLKLSIF